MLIGRKTKPLQPLMIQAYNFLASWQLFPEKGTYEFGERPKSGIYKIEAYTDKSDPATKKELAVYHNWVSLENQAFASEYRLLADGGLNDFNDPQMADKVQASFPVSISVGIHF